MTEPQGIVAILVNQHGIHMASATCFENSAPGGIDVDDMQRREARLRLARAFMSEYCMDDVAEVTAYTWADRIMGELCAKKKYRVIYVRVGETEEL